MSYNNCRGRAKIVVRNHYVSKEEAMKKLDEVFGRRLVKKDGLLDELPVIVVEDIELNSAKILNKYLIHFRHFGFETVIEVTE